jgi:hypothetical protein
MGTQELKLEDAFGRTLHFSKFAGQIIVTPIPHKIGDAIALNDEQAHWLFLYLKEHLERARFPDRVDP